MFKPAKVIVHGIDITKAVKKAKAEAIINKWAALTDKLKDFVTVNAYVKIKITQLLDDANSVFYKINADINCLYTAEKFLEKYLAAGLALAQKYENADKAEESVSKGNYAEIKQKIRDNFEAMADFFHNNFDKLTGNDVRLITEFLDLIEGMTNL